MLRKNTSSAADARTKVNTLIGEGTVFDGNMTSSDTIRIDGTINGNCVCEETLIVGTEGQIIGNITAQNIIISGRVQGDIIANGKLEFLPTGRLTGNITANALVIDEGAYFDGKCTMTDSSSSHSYSQESE